MKLQLTSGSWIINIITVYMATIVRELRLAAKRALFSCIDQALLARCPRHIQSVFNLIVDILREIHVMVNWSTAVKKYIRWPVSWLHGGLKCTTHWGYVFFKVIRWSVIGLIDHRLRSIKKNNLTWRPFAHYAIARSRARSEISL